MTNDEKTVGAKPISGFVIRISFVIRHSDFVILWRSLRLNLHRSRLAAGRLKGKESLINPPSGLVHF